MSPKPLDQEIQKFLPQVILGGCVKRAKKKMLKGFIFALRERRSSWGLCLKFAWCKQQGLLLKSPSRSSFWDKSAEPTNEKFGTLKNQVNFWFFVLKFTCTFFSLRIWDLPNFRKYFVGMVSKSMLIILCLFKSLQTNTFGLQRSFDFLSKWLSSESLWIYTSIYIHYCVR